MDIYYDCQTEYTMDRGTQDEGSFRRVHYNMTGMLCLRNSKLKSIQRKEKVQPHLAVHIILARVCSKSIMRYSFVA